MALLETKDITKSFGGLRALEKVSLKLIEGSIVGLIGPNGSGKTTLFNCITGVIPADEGTVLFRETVVSGAPTHGLLKQGLGRTFQLSRLFAGMTVVENVVSTMRGWSNRTDVCKAREALHFLEISALANEYVEDLSYGQRKLVELARLLVHKPVCYMLDEPFAGINPSLAAKIIEDVRRLREKGATFLIVEHNMSILSQLTDRLVVLDQGRLIADGAPEIVLNDATVADAYLGKKRG